MRSKLIPLFTHIFLGSCSLSVLFQFIQKVEVIVKVMETPRLVLKFVWMEKNIGSKPWISQKKMIILLNEATDIINLWQQSGGNQS
ncbi:unnamed protein product, partial [Vitis vinifera]